MGRHEPFKPGFDPANLPVGLQKLAMLAGLYVGLQRLFGTKRFREDQEQVAKAQRAIGLTGEESSEFAIEHCLKKCREAQFNRAEMAKAESLIRGAVPRTASAHS